MTTPENPENPPTKICLLDFTYEELEKILGDEDLARQITEFDESSAISRIDELMNLHEAPVAGYLLNEKSVMEVRTEWTVEIPQILAESIGKFLAKNK